MRRKFSQRLLQAGVVSAIMVAGMAIQPAALAATAQSVSAEAGKTVTIAATRKVEKLSIAPGASLKAPEGKALVLIVDGVQRDIAPGDYEGEIVLAVVDPTVVPYAGSGPYDFLSALHATAGGIDAGSSVTQVVSGGSYDGSRADGVLIRSTGEAFNGVYVTGDTQFGIDDSLIDLTGNATNDFVGYGAGVAVTDKAGVTIANSVIRTKGTVRTAVFIGGTAKAAIKDSVIEVANGQLPADYQFSIIPGQMQEAPYGLGLVGNVRAINLVDQGTLSINNSVIRAQGWGALSTDGAGPTRMSVIDSVIEAVESGYGAYANGDAIDSFTNSVIIAADYALIIGGNGSGVFDAGTVAKSGRIGVMMHQGTGGGLLSVKGGSQLLSARTAIQVKGRGANVDIDGGTVQAGNGILLQTMQNDDPIMKAMAAGGAGGPGGPGAPPAEGDGPPPPPPPGGAPMSTEVFPPDVKARFANTSLTGNVYHAMGETGYLTLTLENAALTGQVSTSTTQTFGGADATKETYFLVGEVVNTIAPVDGKSLTLILDGTSAWYPTGTSYLDMLSLAKGAVIASASGKPVSITVNGKPVKAKAGSYEGKIVVTSPDAPMEAAPITRELPAAPPPPPPMAEGGAKLDFSAFAAAIDTDGDGKLTRKEWLAQGLPTISFDGFENGRGYVTIEDYSDKPAPPGIDMNGDGSLSIEEFLAFDKRMQNAPPPGAPAE